VELLPFANNENQIATTQKHNEDIIFQRKKKNRGYFYPGQALTFILEYII
jgi:hypothetical protein